ncbi:MAG: histidinol dehydrogenase [Armatimonadota bacterium]
MRLRTVYLGADTPSAVESVINRQNTLLNEEAERAARKIVEQVRFLGESALLDYTRKFDAPDIQSIKVSEQELSDAQTTVAEEILFAIARVRRFHKEQMRVLSQGWDASGAWAFEDEHGNRMGQKLVPIRRVGVYVPGGKADYPSSVVMNCVPALIAGVEQIVVCCPPNRDSSLPSSVLFACAELGIHEVYKLGGAQAIAAMAFGVGMERVDKIVGPGNAYVNAAKRMVWGLVGLDCYAGPSEVCILADDGASPDWVAADLLTQLEHGEDCAGFVIALSEELLESVKAETLKQAKTAQRRDIILAALRDHSAFFLANNREDACDLANRIAPEHLTLMVREPEDWLPLVRCAGCVYLGDRTPQAAGDYLLGASHTLPTARAARFASPLSVLEFLKVMSVSRMCNAGLSALAAPTIALAESERLPSHADGVRKRLANQE